MASKRRKQAEKSNETGETFDDSRKPISVMRFFTAELTRGYLLEREEEKYAQKRQRVYTFMKTPRELEKFSTYGFFQCVDAFLFIFTFLPLRILLAVLKVITAPCGFMRSRNLLEPAQICDILKGVILVVCFFIMMHIDTSMMYHLVRGQATIKLYVFFNMLDMADRLLSNFGHDILDALFWTATEPRGRKRDHLGTLPHLAIAIVYVIIHTMLILFQATVLNVAFNSHNKSLLVIMMSNNFVEIKANLFKKVDVKHLYQIACSDVKERFHYVLLLSVVCIRNMTEVSWNLDYLWVLLPDAIMVLVSEVLVDWGKHAFILKFNEIPADVYGEFKVKLAIDMANSRQSQAFTDHSDLVSRRMGLTPLPLACLLFRILSKSVKLTSVLSYSIVFVLYLCLISFKVLNSIILLGHSYKVIDSSKAERQSQSSSQSEGTEEAEEGEVSVQKQTVGTEQTTQAPSISPAKHKRNASDSTVSKNFSEIFSADSYTELTFVQDTSVIEHSGGIEFETSSLTNSASDSKLPDQNSNANSVKSTSNVNVPIMQETISQSHEKQLKSHDIDLKSHDIDLKSHDTVEKSHDIELVSHDNPSVPAEVVAESDDISRSQDAQETEVFLESGPGKAGFHPVIRVNSFEDSLLVQRNQRRFFVSFDTKPSIGSSDSMPETLGHDDKEGSENSRTIDSAKDEKLD